MRPSPRHGPARARSHPHWRTSAARVAIFRPIVPAGAAGSVGPMVPERLQPLLEEAAPLAARFAAAGWRLYLVGGSVRDAILGEKVAPDLDFTTNARPDDIEAVVAGWADAVWDQGRRFGTIGIKTDGRTYEITTHRAEAYASDSRK